MKRNIEKVLEAVRSLDSRQEGVATQELSDSLKMDRTLVSRLLNQLVEEGAIMKQGNRPVLYFYVESMLHEHVLDKETVFDTMIGANGSLRQGIEQCKSAVTYPNGLTILFTGHSGVGKSYLASLVFQYAKQEEIISEKANFIVFNCADYANNADLLSSKLFGYKKGAFTGANEDQIGIIAQADGGYLFLDEVHRLSPEGQEKLFLLLDKGIYQQLGDKNYHKVNVRLICATTEDPKKVLVDTFLRRIPISVNLPDLSKRNIRERLEFIQFFYSRESAMFHKKIKITKKVINYLLNCSLAGNIGELMNIIKVSCANASRKALYDVVFVDLDDLAVDNETKHKVQEYYQDDVLEVDEQDVNKHSHASDLDGYIGEVNESIQEMHDQLKHWHRSEDQEEQVMKNIRLCVNRISDVLYFRNYYVAHALYDNLFASHVENGLKLIEKAYGIKYYGNSVKTISSVLLALKDPLFQLDEYQKLYQDTLDMMKLKGFKFNIMANRLLQYLKDSFCFAYGSLEELYLSMYILTMVPNKNHNDINVVILAHGYSTASSIASVVNQLHSNYIVESFDMPIDMEPMDIVEEIKDYAKHLKKDQGTIFLVDMGSLFDIYSLVKDSFDGEVVVINNISTHLAIAVGSMVNQGKSIIDIVDSVIRNCEIQYKYYERKGKKKAIVTTCASGIGTAYKIRDMIKKCIIDDRHLVEVVSCDYFTLKNMGKSSEIFSKYDVQLIITTLGLNIPGVPTMLFSDLFSRENEDKIRGVFKKLYDEESVEQIINNLMKMLTLENVISRLIILNPNRVIDNVDAILNRIEEFYHIRLDSNLKLTLYIHIAIMIERCVLVKQEEEEQVRLLDPVELQHLRDIFDDCLTEFEVTIPDQELEIILRLIKEYQRDGVTCPGEDE